MKYTNKQDLPKQFMRAIKKSNEQYDGKNYGDYISVSSLVDSPHIRNLKQEHADELTTDAIEMVNIVLGNGLHNIMELGKRDIDIVEERFFGSLDGWTINGKPDLYDVEKNILWDWKSCKTWAYIFKDNYEKWKHQLWVYTWLLKQSFLNKKPDKIKNMLFFKDFSLKKSKRKSDYPNEPIVIIEHELPPMEVIVDYIKERLKAHEQENCYKCSRKMRWQDPDVYAIYPKLKSGDGYYKNSKKNIEGTREEAELWAEENLDRDYKIEFRKAELTRCKNNYCNVNEWCPFWQDKKKEEKT